MNGHKLDPNALGVPYARAGLAVRDGQPVSTATCPVCGEVFYGDDSKSSTRRYAEHYTETAKAEAENPSSRDYYDDDGQPMTCNDCDRPIFYDYADEAYHHAVDGARGCFLIAAEDRPNDTEHPLVTA